MMLTKKQEGVLSFISDFIAANGFPPTRAEIAKGVGFRSPNAAEDHLKALSRSGAIELIHGIARGIRIRETA
ncbi:LexA family transcriptional regulator [Edwardsiella tarda]|uniref:LexA family transcriptional regulator n=1 Tax=Edwardsiella tarda TaxID=636 RepID=A0A2A7U187_EDWTA|nr:LexA family transcriptional regulator [Edwardsiella tarda]